MIWNHVDLLGKVETEMIRVAIVEDDPVWVSLMTEYVKRQDDMEVVATALSKDAAIAIVDGQIAFDVILMDINLSGNRNDGINAALYVCDKTKAKVIMISGMSDKDLITDSFSAGACNYIRKEHCNDLPAVIRSACNDTTPIEVLLEDYRMLREIDMMKDLTPCEKDILRLSKEGLSRTEMQSTLMKSENTVKSQIKSLKRKLNVRTLQEAVQRIRNRGIG